MARLYREAPYRDYYDPSKGYVQQLAIPGRVAQAVEFTQLGSMFLDLLKRMGDVILKDGNIVQGCSLMIKGTTASISEGKIYLDGIIHHVDACSLEIVGVGKETIGCKIKETIVTEVEDPNFYDPAAGSENYGQPGTHRVKQEVVFAVNDETCAPVYRLNDGSLVTTVEQKPQLEVIEDMLARRTYDESGNYRVDGLVMRDKNRDDDNRIYLTLTKGKAYVRGYEIVKPADMTFSVAKSKEYRSIFAEPKSFNRGTATYKLNNNPLKRVNSIVVTLEITQNITRGAIAGGIDYLPLSPVVNVKEVKSTDSHTTYDRGTDWQLVNDGIDWSLLGKEPGIGTQYTVKYQYKKILVPDVDYTVSYAEGNASITLLNHTSIVDSTEVLIDYDFYLARKDLIAIDKKGDIVVVEGKSDILRLVEAPIISDDDILPLGTVTVEPNSNRVLIVNNSVERMSMSSLQKVVKRVEDIEYDMAITDLDEEAMTGEPPTQLKGVFTDKFIGFSKIDLGHPQFNAAIDISRQEMTLPCYNTVNTTKPNEGSFDTNIGYIGQVITAPFEEVLALSQPYVTTSMLINPYSVFDKLLPVYLEPSVDNWIDESTVNVEHENVKTTQLRRWWKHKGESWADEERRKWEALGFKDGGESLNWSDGKKTTSTTTSEVILDEAIPNIRVRDVIVKAYGFAPSTDNIKCTFDDIPVNLSPLGDTTVGTSSGSVRANSKGAIMAKFTIPNNVACGTKDVKIISPTGEGSATYTANGRKKVTQNTIIKETIIVNTVDPLAQSFQFSEDYTLTGLDIFVETKDEVCPLVVQVRNMVNGYPGTVSYCEQVIQPSDIKVSSNGSVATHVKFDSPVLCKANTQYCFVVMTDSSIASLYAAKLGEQDKITGESVSRNAYTAGVLFSSSNALTWTAHQDMDLKFNLYRAKYNGKGVILFDDIAVNQADRLLLAIEQLRPLNTGVSWYFSINNGAWTPIELYDDRDTTVIANKISLKAEIQASDSRSPMISGETLNIISFLNQKEAYYISRNVTLPDSYNNIKVIVNMALPTGTSAKVYYATDGAGSVWTELTGPKVSPVDEEFVQYEYNKASIGGTPKNYRVKIELKTTNPLVRPRAKKLINILKTV